MATAAVAIGLAVLSEKSKKRAEKSAERKRGRTEAALESKRQAASAQASQEAREKLRKRQRFGLQSTTKTQGLGDAPVFKKTLLGQ